MDAGDDDGIVDCERMGRVYGDYAPFLVILDLVGSHEVANLFGGKLYGGLAEGVHVSDALGADAVGFSSIPARYHLVVFMAEERIWFNLV